VSDWLPDAPDSRSLGSTTREWLNLYIGDAGRIYFGLGQDVDLYRSALNQLKTNDSFDALDLDIGGTSVITAGLVLQNVTADTAIITSGVFNAARVAPDVLTTQGDILIRNAAGYARLAAGIAGRVLQTGGPGADPSWVAAPPPGAHENTHVKGGIDDIDSPLDARALALANQGEIVFHAAAANTLAALPVGAANQALLSGGAGANVSWGAPPPAAHAAAHLDGAADELDPADLAGTGGAAGEIIESDGAALSYVEPDGRYDPAAHRTTHEPEGADEVRGIDLPNAPGADETGWGLETTATAGENVEAGETCYRNADGKYYLSDANLIAAMPAVVMAMEDLAADAEGRFLHIGYMRQDAWNWTPASGEDGLLYASATPGAMTPDQPAVADDLVQVVAYIIDDDHVFFNPSYELVTVS